MVFVYGFYILSVVYGFFLFYSFHGLQFLSGLWSLYDLSEVHCFSLLYAFHMVCGVWFLLFLWSMVSSFPVIYGLSMTFL
uniref:Putative cytochrome b-like protein n=1 Tax=Ixodes ricinus TaxID=34613 RepID=A0A147BK13_IXORI